MRETKFRAWLKKEKEMVEVDVLSIYQGDVLCDTREHKGYWSMYKFDNIELMQYTGLKDQNGTEIYEGDIVRSIYDNFIYDHFEEKTTIGKVVFNECGAYVVNNKGDVVTNLAEIDTTMDCEVLGNIYENPELLEEIK